MSFAVGALSKTLHCYRCVHFKISSWFSKAKLDHCNCALCKSAIAFCLGKPDKACQLPMDPTPTSKKMGLFWSESPALCGN